jgi:hypothetical protein
MDRVGGGAMGDEESPRVLYPDSARDGEGVRRRGIIQYLEYQSVCSLVRIGSPRPLSRKRVCPPPGTNILALQRKSHFCIHFLVIARPQYQFPQSCERNLYSQDRSTYFPAAEYNRQIDRGNICKSLADTCGNWDCGRAIPFLEIFV